MIPEMLRRGVETILCCPCCKGVLTPDDGWAAVGCASCRRRFPITQGIINFLEQLPTGQEAERHSRDDAALAFGQKTPEELLEVIGNHHCIPLMRALTRCFQAHFHADDWVLDVGIGWGWHWAEEHSGPRVVGIDMSLNNLLIARRLLENRGNEVLLVCADASQLPIRDNALSGLWSVQVFQHMPETVFRTAKKELARAMRDRFFMEIYNFNPACMIRVLYWLTGKTFYMSDCSRNGPKEWARTWEDFKVGPVSVGWGYSELFFHPPLRLKPRRYPLRLESFFSRFAEPFAALLARQAQVSISKAWEGSAR